MKPNLFRIAGLIAFLLTGFLSEKATWAFSLNRHKLVTLPLANQGAFPDELLSQSWTLSDEGGQSFVFTSQDGLHVLKFFKDQPRPWLQWPSYQALKQRKLLRTLTGYALLQERCPDLSITLCLHFNPLPQKIPATLIDRLGISHSVDLNSYLFVLQKKVSPLHAPTTPQEKQTLLHQTTQFLQTLAKAHLQDHDPRLHLNLGQLENHLVLIDPGRIAESDSPSSDLPDKYLEFLR